MDALQKRFEAEIREMVDVCHALAARQYTTSHGGNVSWRVGPDEVLITPTKVNKGKIEFDDIVIVGMERGDAVRGARTETHRRSSDPSRFPAEAAGHRLRRSRAPAVDDRAGAFQAGAPREAVSAGADRRGRAGRRGRLRAAAHGGTGAHLRPGDPPAQRLPHAQPRRGDALRGRRRALLRAARDDGDRRRRASPSPKCSAARSS